MQLKLVEHGILGHQGSTWLRRRQRCGRDLAFECPNTAMPMSFFVLKWQAR